jgi:rare lipoprotein A
MGAVRAPACEVLVSQQMRTALVVVVGGAVLLSGCHRKRTVRVPPPPAGPAMVENNETGLASWYGHPYHGRPAANGEIYDMEQMTAAHRTLPFGTWVRVHDLDNGKSVDVRINDRGPFVDGRIIDLSHAAARAIAMIGPGTAQVRLEILSLPAAAGPGRFAVQVGAFQNRDNAERLRREMEAKYGAARVVERAGNPILWRVLVGTESTQEGAAALAQRIRAESGAATPAFVVRLDSV